MRGMIVIGGMVLGLLMGCNNGGEDPQKVFLKSVVSLGNDFLTVFTYFGDMVGDVLGFNKDTPKSKVGDYFKKVKETVEATKDKLNKIVSDMREKGNPNASGVEIAVNKLVTEKLDKIIDGAKKASEAIGEAKDLIGNVAGSAAGGAGGKNVEDLVKGIKEIVNEVLSEKEGTAEAGDDKKADDLGNRTSSSAAAGEAGKLFTSGSIESQQPKKSAADASKAVGAVTGADILKAMANNSDSEKLAKETNGNSASVKDTTIAGGIALRAMAKEGKFANGSTGAGDVVNAVKGAATSAVIKALNTLNVAIRKTIDEGLKTVKEAMNINPETIPVNSEGTTNK